MDDTLQRLSGVVQHGFSQVDKRLDQVDKRFDRNEIRYTGFDSHFQAINQRIDRFMFFSLGLTVTVGMAVVTLVQMVS